MLQACYAGLFHAMTMCHRIVHVTRKYVQTARVLQARQALKLRQWLVTRKNQKGTIGKRAERMV